jgi:hypothetical protein
MEHVEQGSLVRVPASRMWAHATSPAGINAELRPWLRMTIPRSLRGRTIEDAPIGEVAGRSWILLLGLIPVEYDDLRLVELEPGRRFLERSSMLTLSAWEHERVIESAGEESCQATDRLGFELHAPLGRIPGSSSIVRAIVTALFRHRHRRLKQMVVA